MREMQDSDGSSDEKQSKSGKMIDTAAEAEKIIQKKLSYKKQALLKIRDKAEMSFGKQKIGTVMMDNPMQKKWRLNTIREEEQSQGASQNFSRQPRPINSCKENYVQSQSSYEISVDLSEGNIGGETQHNMHEKYYKPLCQKKYVNPLAKEQKASRPRYSPLMAEFNHSFELGDGGGAPDKSMGSAEDVQKLSLERSESQKKVNCSENQDLLSSPLSW